MTQDGNSQACLGTGLLAQSVTLWRKLSSVYQMLSSVAGAGAEAGSEAIAKAVRGQCRARPVGNVPESCSVQPAGGRQSLGLQHAEGHEGNRSPGNLCRCGH